MMETIWAWHPPVGVWIGILGFLGVIVPLIRDLSKIGRREKAVRTFVVFALLLLEIKSVYQDRNEHDLEQAATRVKEEKHFETIAEGIKAAIRESDSNFQLTMNRSDRITSGVSDAIRVQTGGDSFAYITFTLEPAIVRFNGLGNPSGPWFLVSITSHGKYPLREVHATLIDDERRMTAMEEYNEHPDGDWMKAIQSGDTQYQYPYLRPQSPEAPGGDVETIGAYPLPKGMTKRLTIAFSSLNGYWDETVHLGLVNGMWRQCLSVMGPTVKQARKPFINCDSDWPEGKALAEKDWARVKPPVQQQ